MTRILFIQGGSRWKLDEKNNLYTETNFNDSVWKRYRSYCDELTVLLRREQKVYKEVDAVKKFNKFDQDSAFAVIVEDIYRPILNVINIKKRINLKKIIKREVMKSDKVIIRSLGNFYTDTAIKYAKKLKKEYLIEVTGFTFEGMWYHSFRGKMIAFFKEKYIKKLIKKSPYVVYVTQDALQKRYPSIGKTIGCSDVEIQQLSNNVLEERLKKIKRKNGNIILGTAGFLDVKFKGQCSVVKAIAELKKEGIANIEYHLIGAGKGDEISKLAKKLEIEDQISIEGILPHEKVFDWYDDIDIYIHPGYIEGLCRSIVEAMSRALPVCCASVGGNIELAKENLMFEKGNVCEIKEVIKILLDTEEQKKAAQYSFFKAHEYEKEKLDFKRDKFYREFIGDGNA